MSEAVAEKAEKAPAAAGGGGNKKLLIIVLAVNVLLVGGLGYVLISNKSQAEPAKAAGKAKAEGHEAKEEGEAEEEGHEAKEEGEAEEEAEEDGKKDEKHVAGKFGPLLEIGSFVANLASVPGQQPRYCKATVYVEVKNEEAKLAVEAAVVPIKAEALMMISNAHADDVIGQEKITLLSAALLKRANKLVGKNAIKRIYFSELVVQ